MAYIDKTYVNKDQYRLAREFWQSTLDQQKRELPRPISLYYDEFPEGDECVLWNTSFIEDIWLRKNCCPLDFIQDRLNIQYGSSGWNKNFGKETSLDILANICTFEQNAISLLSIENNQHEIWFYHECDNGTYIYDSDDTILIYGTTLFFKIVDAAISELIWNQGEFNAEINFNFFGAYLRYKDREIYTENDQKIQLGYFNDNLFNLPKFKLSLDVCDTIGVDPNLIYFSSDNFVYPLTSYIDHEKLITNPDSFGKAIKAGRFDIPNYILRSIK